MESFSILVPQATDQNKITFLVNGEKWTNFKSIYEMNSDSRGYIVRTGLTSGIDIFFGTS